MVAPSIWFRYFASKFEYSVAIAQRAYGQPQLSDIEILNTVWRNVLGGRLTFLHSNKGEEMGSDMIGTLLVRKIPVADPSRVDVSDVVVLKDPMKPENYLVRQLAAVEGDEMVSDDKACEPFVIDKGYCWVLGSNNKLQPKQLYDSRTFGPVGIRNIVGRVIYCLRNAVDHGPVKNSEISTSKDSPVLEVELDIDEMAKDHKA